MRLDDLRGDELLGLRILVVEDEPETLELVALTLRRAGADVAEASGADAALALLESHQPIIIVSDLQMPDLDGFALMRLLRERTTTPPIAIALSASSSPADAQRALAAGFAVHVAKPIAMEDLIASIRAVAPHA